MRNRTQISFWLAAAGIALLAVGASIVVTQFVVPREAASLAGSLDWPLVGAGLLTILMSSISIFLARRALPRSRFVTSTKVSE